MLIRKTVWTIFRINKYQLRKDVGVTNLFKTVMKSQTYEYTSCWPIVVNGWIQLRNWPRNSKILEPEYVYTIDDTVARWPKILTNNFKSVI